MEAKKKQKLKILELLESKEKRLMNYNLKSYYQIEKLRRRKKVKLKLKNTFIKICFVNDFILIENLHNLNFYKQKIKMLYIFI